MEAQSQANPRAYWLRVGSAAGYPLVGQAQYVLKHKQQHYLPVILIELLDMHRALVRLPVGPIPLTAEVKMTDLIRPQKQEAEEPTQPATRPVWPPAWLRKGAEEPAQPTVEPPAELLRLAQLAYTRISNECDDKSSKEDEVAITVAVFRPWFVALSEALSETRRELDVARRDCRTAQEKHERLKRWVRALAEGT